MKGNAQASLVIAIAIIALLYYGLKFIAMGQWLFPMGSIFTLLIYENKLLRLKNKIKSIAAVDESKFEPTWEEQESLNELRVDIQKNCENEERVIKEWKERLGNAKSRINNAYQTAKREGLSFNQDGNISARSNLGKQLLAAIEKSEKEIAAAERNIHAAESTIYSQQNRYHSALNNTKGAILRRDLQETEKQCREAAFHSFKYRFGAYVVFISYLLVGAFYTYFFSLGQFISYPIMTYNAFFMKKGHHPSDPEIHGMVVCLGVAILLAAIIIGMYSKKYPEKAMKRWP